MSISPYLKQIARGSKGASDLSRADARELFSQILTNQVSDLERGAFCIAMRIKGETSDELLGFHDAVLKYLPKFEVSRTTVVLPSYNGARKTTLLTPWLARLLVNRGYAVLIHGLQEEATRLGSEQLFRSLGWPVATRLDEVVSHLSNDHITYCSLENLCPELFNIVSVRKVIGLRNTGHILAKLINPVTSQSLQLCNYTHPAYPSILDQFFIETKANVILMRGHEGEPVASPRRLPELHIRLREGNVALNNEPILIESDQDYQDTIDINETTRLYESFLKGSAHPASTLTKQVQVIVETLQAIV